MVKYGPTIKTDNNTEYRKDGMNNSLGVTGEFGTVYYFCILV